MNTIDWKSWLIEAYYRGTLPYRWWSNARASREGQLPVCVLFHHRVADDQANPWTISTNTFQRQLDWLQRNCDIISLAEMQRRIREGTNERLSVCITFDDGYADNCLHAVPLLLRRRIPFTYFVTTENLRDGEPFPHDMEIGHPLAPNSIDEIKAMADAGVEIGVHTSTHANLGTITDDARLHDEIVQAKEDLQRWTGRPARYFSFPYGQISNLSVQAAQLIHRSGYAGLCSAFGGYNYPGGESFHIRRFHADSQMSRFRNWMTIDPRKAHIELDFRVPGEAVSKDTRLVGEETR